MRRYTQAMNTPSFDAICSIEALLLVEARFAKQYWSFIKKMIRHRSEFTGRVPRSEETANRLLDIGYHHLANAVTTITKRLEVPTDLGLIHTAHASDSAPFVYDLMELFRADIVDAELVRYFRLKKKPVSVTQKEIARFLHAVNSRLEKKYFLAHMHTCHTYRYYMELQIQRFISAVNRREVYVPMTLPFRHDTRCP